MYRASPQHTNSLQGIQEYNSFPNRRNAVISRPSYLLSNTPLLFEFSVTIRLPTNETITKKFLSANECVKIFKDLSIKDQIYYLKYIYFNNYYEEDEFNFALEQYSN